MRIHKKRLYIKILIGSLITLSLVAAVAAFVIANNHQASLPAKQPPQAQKDTPTRNHENKDEPKNPAEHMHDEGDTKNDKPVHTYPEPSHEVLVTDLSIAGKEGSISYTATISSIRPNNTCTFIAVANNSGQKITGTATSTEASCKGELKDSRFTKGSDWQITFTYKSKTSEASMKKAIIIL